MCGNWHNDDAQFEGTKLISVYINYTTNEFHTCSDDYMYIIVQKNMNVMFSRKMNVSVLNNTNSVIKILRP